MIAVSMHAVSLAWLLVTSVTGVQGSAFLRQKVEGELQRVTLEIVESALLSELAVDSERLRGFEDELRTMYVALPKNERGTLDPAAVRYALHRFFVNKHGWYVKGLEPAGLSWNSSAPTSITKSRVPAYIQSLFESRLHGAGLGLHELAVFAATLSDFVHNEALGDVIDLYDALKLSTIQPVRSQDADRVIKAYILQILDGTTTIQSMAKLRELEQAMIEDFPSWEDFKMWVQDVRNTMAMQRMRHSFIVEENTLEHVIREVQEINDKLGVFQNIECRSLKSALANMEYKNSGRVLLSDFYREGMRGEFLFIEQIDYLRKLGALDETDPRHPSVVIANYLGGQANCLASTSFHSVCCIDECEGLMGQLERDVAAPSAPPARIAELVRNLHSDTVDAPRNLSVALMSRLGEIADHHGGQVLLHGRLFAQWMHHAYPMECPYPHAAGTTTPLTPDEWMDEVGADEVAAPVGERQRIMELDRPHEHPDALPWMAVEELVVAPVVQDHGPARKFAAFATVLAFAVPVIRIAVAVSLPCYGKAEKWHLV